MDVRALIRELGGLEAVSGITGANPKAVSMWGTRNDIPAEHHIALWRAAQDRGVDWCPPGAADLELAPKGAAA